MLFGILAFIITVGMNILFWQGIIKKEIIPHPFTFFIWGIVLTITSIELITRHEYFWAIGVIILTLSTIWCIFIGVLEWKKIRTNWLDWLFFITGIFLIIFWKIEPQYKYVLIIMIIIDATAYASSFKKAWLQPFTEKSLPYFISVWGNICTILAISVWNFENLGMWIWTICVNLTFACFVLGRQYYFKQKNITQ